MDIEGFFDHVNHQHLKAFLMERIADGYIMEWLSAIGFFFIGAIAVSAFSMWEEHSTTATRFLSAFAFLLFFVGLLVIAATFLGWSVPTNGYVIAIFFGYAIIGGVGMAYSEHRRLRKLKEPMIS